MLTKTPAIKCIVHGRSPTATGAAYRIMLYRHARPEGDERDFLHCYYPRTTHAILPPARSAPLPERLGCRQNWLDGSCGCASPRLPHSNLPRVWQRSKPHPYAIDLVLGYEYTQSPEHRLRSSECPPARERRKKWSPARLVEKPRTWKTSRLSCNLYITSTC